MKSAALCPALSLLKGIYLWDDSCHKAKSTRRNLDFHPQHVRNRIRNRIRNGLCYPLVNYQKPWKDPPKSPLFPWEHSRTFNGHGFQFTNCKKLPGRVPSPTIPNLQSCSEKSTQKKNILSHVGETSTFICDDIFCFCKEQGSPIAISKTQFTHPRARFSLFLCHVAMENRVMF